MLSRLRPSHVTALAVSLLVACHRGAPSAAAPSAVYDPPHALGPLFADVQMARVFPDSKTLVDAEPRHAPADVLSAYLAGRSAAGFDLKTFVAQEFAPPGAA